MEAKVVRVLTVPEFTGVYWAIKVEYLTDTSTGVTTLMLRSLEDTQLVSVGYTFKL